MVKRILSIMILALLCLSSCKNYYIPVESFKQQMKVWDTAKLRKVVTTGSITPGLAYQSAYMAYPVDTIYCFDKKGKPAKLVSSPAIEIRFTDVDGKRTVFYYDQMHVNKNMITGTQSRILHITKTISIDNIVKIEVQNGGKNYHYTN